MNPSSNDAGYLEIYLGCMYSGKTSKLLEIYKQCKFCNISVAVINHNFDTRYHNTMMSSHDKVMVPCIQANTIKEIWDLNSDNNNAIHLAKIILINEAQFFEDLYPYVVKMLDAKKTVIISGLDGDFKRAKFGQILDLIPLCDKITKLHSLCSLCKNGNPGIFSRRISDETQQTLIGSDNYLPVCRKCYETTFV
jgi:thymidine kinase